MALGITNGVDKGTNKFVSNTSIKIITDEPASDAPDFKKYANQLSMLIMNSMPRFTVGIYGGWGNRKNHSYGNDKRRA